MGDIPRGQPGAVSADAAAPRHEPLRVPGHNLDGAGAGFADVGPAIILSDRAG